MLQMVVGLLCHAGWGVPMYNWKKKIKTKKKRTMYNWKK